MRHALILITVALVALTIVFTLYRPDLLADYWLWIVGLMGPIIGTIQAVVKKARKLFQLNNQ